MGKPMIMGRKTFAGFPVPLPGRRHIVLTRDATFTAPGAEVVRDVEEAVALAGNGEVMVIGGAEIFTLFAPLANRIEATDIHADFAGDTVLAAPGANWREIARDEHASTEGRPGFAFVTLERVGSDA